jgi:hypothetical protein
LGVSDVFMNVEPIALGRDFREAVTSAIDASGTVPVLKCHAWLGVAWTVLFPRKGGSRPEPGFPEALLRV